MGECLYPCGSLLKVYCTPPHLKANFSLSFSCKVTKKNVSFTSSAAIHGCVAACSVAVKVAILGSEAVSGAVLTFKRQ